MNFANLPTATQLPLKLLGVEVKKASVRPLPSSEHFVEALHNHRIRHAWHIYRAIYRHNSLIDSLSAVESSKDADRTKFGKEGRQHLLIDDHTTMLDFFSRLLRPDTGAFWSDKVYGNIISDGFIPDVRHCNLLMKAHKRTKDAKRVVMIYDALLKGNTLVAIPQSAQSISNPNLMDQAAMSPNVIRPNMTSKLLVLSCLSESGETPELAETWFAEHCKDSPSFALQAEAHAALLVAWGKSAQTSKVWQVLRWWGINPEHLAATSSHQEAERSLRSFRGLRNMRIILDAGVRALGMSGESEDAMRLFDHIYDSLGVEHGLVSFDSALSALETVGDGERAEAIWRQLWKWVVEATSAMEGEGWGFNLAANRSSTTATTAIRPLKVPRPSLLHRRNTLRKESQVTPLLSSFACMMRHRAAMGDASGVMSIFRLAKLYYVPDAEMFGTAIKALLSSGREHEGLKLYESMVQQGFIPSKEVAAAATRNQ